MTGVSAIAGQLVRLSQSVNRTELVNYLPKFAFPDNHCVGLQRDAFVSACINVTMVLFNP